MYLCLLQRHIIMMHFGNGDKPNNNAAGRPWIVVLQCQTDAVDCLGMAKHQIESILYKR